MGQYGLITTTANTASQLKELNKDYERRRTWSSLYASVDLNKQQAMNTLKYDYSQDISDAYAAAYAEKTAIANSALGQGYKEQVLYDIDASLNEAFDSYKANYLEKKAAIEDTAAEAVSQIDKSLNTQAENINSYRAAPYQYLTNLYNRATGTEDLEKDEKLAKLFEENPNWSKYLTTDENGTRLKSEQELFDEYYVNGNLTIKGMDFYDQMLNELGTVYGSEYSFHNWLANENAELYEWSQSYNPYDYAPDSLGNNTNLSSVQTMFGLASDDQTYQFVERFAGMTSGELTTMFDKYTKAAEDFANKVSDASGRKTKDVVGDINTMISEIETMASHLGIVDDIESELGISFEQLTKGVEENYSKSYSNGQIWWNGIIANLISAGIGASSGFGVGGGIGAAVGAVLGTIVGIGGGIAMSKHLKNENLELAQQSSNAYKQLVVKMTNYAQEKRRQAEIGYKNS